MARMKLRVGKPKDDDSEAETPTSLAKKPRDCTSVVAAAAAPAPSAHTVPQLQQPLGGVGGMGAVLQGLAAIGGLAAAGGGDSSNMLGAFLQAMQPPQQQQGAHIQLLPSKPKASGLPPVAEAEDAEDAGDECSDDDADGEGPVRKKPSARSDPVSELLEQIASKDGKRVCVPVTGGKGWGGGRGKAGGRGGAAPKAKAKAKAKASAKPKAKPKAKGGSLKRPAAAGPKRQFGCSKCRYLVNGCSACR